MSTPGIVYRVKGCNKRAFMKGLNEMDGPLFLTVVFRKRSSGQVEVQRKLETKFDKAGKSVMIILSRSQYNSTLQNLRAAFKWSEAFDLPLNAGKRAHVSLGGPPPFPLSLTDGTAIPIVDCAKDLGVTITADFKTSQHCKEAANRARRVLFQMRRGFAVS